MANIRVYKIDHEKKQETLLSSVKHARSWWSRLRGLLGSSELREDEGLLISPCAQVHTFGMRYPLDVVFLDRAYKVVKCVSSVKPCRLSGAWRARHTLELSAGSIARNGLAEGDQLAWSTQTNGVMR